MMLIPLIVVPCAIVGIGTVYLLDRAGWLPGGGTGGAGGAYRPRDAALTNRRLGLAALVAMGAWILAWIVLLIVGLSVVWV